MFRTHAWARLLFPVLLPPLLWACSATSLKDTWMAPDAGPLQFRKTLAVFMSAEEGVRRAGEDELVARIAPAPAVASYTLLTRSEIADVQALRERLLEQGFDGAVVMRVVSTEKEQHYEPPVVYPMPYRSFSGYYAWGWPMVHQPGYLRTDTIVSVETNVYSLQEDKLIWSGVSETFNPENVTSMVGEIAGVVAEELQRRELLRRTGQ